MLPGERRVGGLTCSEVLAGLSEYLDGELDPRRKAQVEAHVGACDVCARFGAGFQHLLQEVRSRMAEPEPIPGDVAARLASVLRETNG